MSVVGEFVVETDGFALGRALCVGEVRCEFDQVVPTDGHATDVWVWTDDVDGFRERVEDRPPVLAVSVRDRVDGGALCSVEWTGDGTDVFAGIVDADLTLLTAAGDGQTWSFRVRAPDWSALTAFREFCTRHGVDLELNQLTRQTEPGGTAADALTSVQRETLAEAFRRGYYDSPRGVTLAELAEEFDVSPRAVSQRLRRGIANLIENSLPTTKSI
ncbi:helix-turn-helix domain-containing protein [Halomarina litorea]|uniref:helix-turn-helix domain-containing protein n=1 Tax=Halomarina litorea TaxID=2961595 RepID=UPI0020C59B42|nr:helix-turn-helix domain-containing protein [Halomarina sp. BCD28]